MENLEECDLESFFLYLYPLVAVSSTLAYMPQIIRLLRSEDIASVSLLSWCVWLIGSIVTLGYGVVHLKDLTFCIVTTLGTILMCGIVCIVLYKRYKYKRQYVSQIPPLPLL